MGRLRSQQRQREVQVMHFCFQKLGEGARACVAAACVRSLLLLVMHFCFQKLRARVCVRACLRHTSCVRCVATAACMYARACAHTNLYTHAFTHARARAHAGIQVVGEIGEPGFLEGGDFFPLGRDLAMVRAHNVSCLNDRMLHNLCCTLCVERQTCPRGRDLAMVRV